MSSCIYFRNFHVLLFYTNDMKYNMKITVLKCSTFQYVFQLCIMSYLKYFINYVEHTWKMKLSFKKYETEENIEYVYLLR